MAKRQFGVSTHLYHGQRLAREHLLEVAAHGFDSVELFATRTHFDYHSDAAIADLQQWLAEGGLVLHGVHAPTSGSYVGGRWGPSLSLASPDAAARSQAVDEARTALYVARRIPMSVFVAHLGLPRAGASADAYRGDEDQRLRPDSRDAARRSIEELQREAAPLGVRVAAEVIPNELSRVGSLVHFVEEDLEVDGVGICLDFGHAHMDGDLVDAIETVSGHLATTHVHDNRGKLDEHLVPFAGTIEWPSALTAIQKIGYDGALLFEIAAHGSPKETLKNAREARQRMERLLA